MNLDKLAVENQAAITINQDAVGEPDQAHEIMPMAVECYRLVGGGSGIVLLG